MLTVYHRAPLILSLCSIPEVSLQLYTLLPFWSTPACRKRPSASDQRSPQTPSKSDVTWMCPICAISGYQRQRDSVGRKRLCLSISWRPFLRTTPGVTRACLGSCPRPCLVAVSSTTDTSEVLWSISKESVGSYNGTLGDCSRMT